MTKSEEMESKFCNLDVAAAMKLKILAANVQAGGKYIGKKTDTSSLLRDRVWRMNLSCLFHKKMNMISQNFLSKFSKI